MRQVILDTETTGLEPGQGHRIIEIGCVELLDRRRGDRVFHQYLNPERDIDEAAEELHGISAEFLTDKPRFRDIAKEFLEFVSGAELVIHNASFDIGFLDAELARLGPEFGTLEARCKVLDSLALARELHPGQRNGLDALCARYLVDNSQRDRHGALLDAEILADVYLAMTGGQTTLELAPRAPVSGATGASDWRLPVDRRPLPVLRASPREREAHERRLHAIENASSRSCLWRELGS